jgi:integrase/recombinase XerD
MSETEQSDRICVLAERYLEERSSAWAPTTLENQSRGLRFFTDFMRAEGRSLSTADVLAFARHVREKKTVRGAPWAERSIEWALAAARGFLRWVLLRGHVLEELYGLIVVRPSLRLPRVIPELEVRKLIEEGPRGCCEKRDRALIELLYGTGLRASEALRLGIDDVDLSEGMLFVRQGKGGKDRVVPFGERVRQAIRVYLREERPTCPGPLFLSIRRRALTREGLEALVARAAGHAGIPRAVSPHRLRHSYATHLLRYGAPLVAIQALLGHASLVSTEVYLSLETKDLARMVQTSHPREARAHRPRLAR